MVHHKKGEKRRYACPRPKRNGNFGHNCGNGEQRPCPREAGKRDARAALRVTAHRQYGLKAVCVKALAYGIRPATFFS